MEEGTFGLAQGGPTYQEKSKRRIIDKDGDGVEDNKHIEAHERDKFYIPNVYSPPVEDMVNTNHGRLPSM